MKAVTVEEAIRRATALGEEKEGDLEVLHGEIDDLYDEILRSLGFGEFVDFVEDTTKYRFRAWYA